MNIKSILTTAIAGFLLAACGNTHKTETDENLPLSNSKPAPGDSAVYGLACDGCTDTVVVLLRNAGGDPVTYHILNATKRHRVFGHPQVGDWLAVIVSKEDSTVADLVVDLEEVKGTWTYQVLPTLRERADMSKKMQNAMMEEMPDSIREILMVPREYGFTLSRHSQASSVGRIYQSSTLEDNSPVTYPPVPHYTEWHPYNGKMILVQDTSATHDAKEKSLVRDTAEFVYLQNDSLVLRFHNGETVSYHRQENARTANAVANAAAAKQAKHENEKLK